MARLPRLVAPGELHLALWRGHHGLAVFRDDQDRRDFLALMQEQLSHHDLQLHAYVLLDHEVQMLVTPVTGDALALWMQGVGRAYGRRYNVRHGLTGTLWDGRFRSTVLEGDQIWLAMVCMDLAPVRAGLAPGPEAYPWSSHAHYRGWRNDGWLAPHARWWALGNTPFAREAAYAQRVQQGLSSVDVARLDAAVRSGWPLGSTAFLQALEAQTGRRVTKERAGRPRKIAADD